MKTRSILAVIVVILLLSACSKSNDTAGSGSSNDPYTIYMKGSVFSAASLTVPLGTKVTWVNNDNMTHTVTANDGSFNSGDIAAGGSYSYTFNSTGTVAYHCIYHSSMTGTVIVGYIR